MVFNTENGSERRNFKRLKLSFIVYYHIDQPIDIQLMVGNKYRTASMLDMSMIGMSITTDLDIPVNTVLSIRFTIVNLYADKDKDRIRAVNITGEVKNNSRLEKVYRIGILFTRMDENDKDIISDFIKLTSQIM